VTRKHIAIVLSGLGAGGAERVVSLLADRWLEQGRRVSIITFDGSHVPIYHSFPQGACICRLGDQVPRGSPLVVFRRLLALRRILRRDPPDVVISFLTKNNVLALLATAGTPVRTICCERNNPEKQPKHKLWNWLIRLLYRRADAIGCQTQGVVRCIPKSARRSVHVIPNPVDLTEVTPVVQGSQVKRLVSVGRLTEQKGFDILIDAFARIAGDFPDWRLDIWGEGEDRAALQERIVAEAMDDRIVLRGLSDVPRGWLAGTDLFVLASRYEGFCNVVAEAMAAGLPVVSADCDFGPSDMITHGVSGSLVPPGSPELLAMELARVMRSPDLRARYAVEARSAIAAFSTDHVLGRWDAMLAEVLGRGEHAGDTVTDNVGSPILARANRAAAVQAR